MIKNFFGGMAVGVANIIPGVSGGTIMVLLGLFNKVTDSISNIFNFKEGIFKGKKDSILFLLQLLVGAGVGLVGFAKILELLFDSYQVETLFWFIGLITFSIPLLVEHEMKDMKINYIYFIVGVILIGGLSLLNPGETNSVINIIPEITVTHLLWMIIVGLISGITMIFPGVSGSMVLLIIGEYYLFKTYVAEVTSFDSLVLIPLIFIGIGVGLGIIISAKVTSYLLKIFKEKTMSLILGLIIMSVVVLIPFNITYSPDLLLRSFLSFTAGGLVIYLFEYLNNYKKKSS